MSSQNFLATLSAHRQLLESTEGDKVTAQTELLSSSLLSSSLQTSIDLESHLQSSTASCQQAQQSLLSQHDRLIHSIDTLLTSFTKKKAQLAHVPEDIETNEDTLMELCTDLKGSQSESAASTFMQSLESKTSALRQLYAARDYLSLLAKAEDLRLKSSKGEDADNQEEALMMLTELNSLCNRVQILSASQSKHLKAVSFLNSQRAQAFSHLVSIRRERLKVALTEAGWPPAPIELDTIAKNSQKEAEEILLGSPELRKRWKELMKLQRQSEKLQLLPVCSARLSSTGGSKKSSQEAQPGAENFQPLLATQILFTPLLLRFYYHFDSSRSTNRLDKPEWYLTHMLNVLRSHAHLFDPSQGPIATLCGNRSSKSPTGTKFNLYAELLHAILRPLAIKVESSIPLLVENSRLLSHTIMQVVQFDQDVRDILPAAHYSSPIHLAESLLSNEAVFEAWVQSEREFATQRLEEETEGGAAWLVGEGEEIEEENLQGSWAAMVQEGNNTAADAEAMEDDLNVPKMKTTRSARAVVGLLDGLTMRYKALPAVTHQLPFLLIQLSILQGYAQRLERSLDAFERMSSVFTRAIPGAIPVGGSPGADANSEGDMVRGLRGLGRLLKACLSAIFLSKHLSSLSSTSFFLELGTQLHSNPEELKALHQFESWQGSEEDKELEMASLGQLVRRTWKSGGKLASGVRPLGGGGQLIETTTGTQKSEAENSTAATNVWENTQRRYDALIMRAQKAVEKLVVSEALEGSRSYTYRSWDDEDEEEGGEGEEDSNEERQDIPTPSLLPCLSTLSTHLTHLIPSLPRMSSNAVYRSIAHSISKSIVDRVILAGGSHRFSHQGSSQFRQDVLQGWMGVVSDVAASESNRLASSTSTALGRRPEAPWQYLLDVSLLLSLPSETSTKQESEFVVTFEQACNAAFEQQSTWNALRQKLHIDDRIDIRLVQEIIKRRIDCPW